MIEINLLPGGGRKKAATTRASVDYAAMLAGITARVGSPYILGAIGLSVLAVLVAGWLFLKQGRDRNVADSRLDKALTDSAHYAGVVAARAKLEAKRDTLLRQVNLIRSIDEDRYIWPHILDEVSRALPTYTWMTELKFVTPVGVVNVVALPKANPADTLNKTGKPKPLPTTIPKEDVRFSITGRTVDIQALTRFMSDLAQSPFIGVVNVEKSEPNSDQGKELTQFVLTVGYKRPDSTLVRRTPFVVTVR